MRLRSDSEGEAAIEALSYAVHISERNVSDSSQHL